MADLIVDASPLGQAPVDEETIEDVGTPAVRFVMVDSERRISLINEFDAVARVRGAAPAEMGTWYGLYRPGPRGLDLSAPGSFQPVRPVSSERRARDTELVIDSDKDSITFPTPGLYALGGPVKGGKSALARAVYERISLRAKTYVRVGEPEVGARPATLGAFADVINAMSVDSATIEPVTSAPRALVVDSALALSVLGGSPGAGGVPRSLYLTLTALHHWAYHQNVYAFLVVNLLLPSDRLVYDQIVGGSTGALITDGVKTDDRSRQLVITANATVRPARGVTRHTFTLDI